MFYNRHLKCVIAELWKGTGTLLWNPELSTLWATVIVGLNILDKSKLLPDMQYINDQESNNVKIWHFYHLNFYFVRFNVKFGDSRP